MPDDVASAVAWDLKAMCQSFGYIVARTWFDCTRASRSKFKVWYVCMNYIKTTAITTTSPGFYEKFADLGSMQPRKSSEIGQHVLIDTLNFSKSFENYKMVLMRVLKMIVNLNKKKLSLESSAVFLFEGL